MPHCVLCHERTLSPTLCSACHDDLRLLAYQSDHLCPRCLRFSLNGIVCGRCQNKSSALTALYASYDYMPPLRQLWHACKHQRQLYLIDTLAELMLAQPPQWLNKHDIDAVVAMPLSRTRLFERGFNQSQLLASAIAANLGCSLLPSHYLQRIHTPAQSTLTGIQRHRNVRGIFRLQGEVRGLRLLLIDDIITTGATVRSLAQTLKISGARQISAWAFAHPK